MKLFSTRVLFLYSILIIALLLSVSFVIHKQDPHEKYVLDNKESVVTWTGSMQFVPQNKHVGYVYVSHGELMIEKGQLVGGTVEVDMNTITDKIHGSDNSLIDHLKSADFFNVKKFPVATFTITNVASIDSKNVNVTGDLTVKGITNAVTFPVEMEVSSGVVSANGKVIIDRTKWNVRHNSAKYFANLADETISDDIEFELKILARKK